MLENIKRICAARHITLAELERESGVGRGVIYRWDKCVPSVDKVKRVADFLGVTVDDLLTEGTET